MRQCTYDMPASLASSRMLLNSDGVHFRDDVLNDTSKVPRARASAAIASVMRDIATMMLSASASRKPPRWWRRARVAQVLWSVSTGLKGAFGGTEAADDDDDDDDDDADDDDDERLLPSIASDIVQR